MDIRLRIGGLARGQEPGEDFRRVAVAQQRAGIAARHPVGKGCNIGLQPDRDGAVEHQGPGFRIDKSAAAKRQHHGRLVEQAGNDLAFAVAECRLAEIVEDFTHTAPGGTLDFMIGITERALHCCCQTPADGRFSGAHQSDQDDGGFIQSSACHPFGIKRLEIAAIRVTLRH